MVAVNCGAIPGTLLERVNYLGTLKAHLTGATQNRQGRFQAAGNGTPFLDEISDLSMDLQAKILRAIQNKVFEPVGSPSSLTLDARIIAATNQDLGKGGHREKIPGRSVLSFERYSGLHAAVEEP